MSVLVILEQRGNLKKCAFEAATAAAAVARAAGLELNAVYMGQSLADEAGLLAGLGIARVYAYENAALGHYSNDTYVGIVESLAKELNATVILGSATALGKELCASVAARLGVELVQDCVSCSWANGMLAVKPIYAGKVVSEVRIQDSPAMLSLRPNVTPVVRDGSLVAQCAQIGSAGSIRDRGADGSQRCGQWRQGSWRPGRLACA
jgi:electron transfer flavoprotein alpha subunit